MRQRLAILLMAATLMVSIPGATRAAVDISANIQINAVADFNEPLTPYGSWETVGSYGRCWHPSHVEADWQPYTVGSWEWTDAGWYWQSDEPWAWACYHYGSWYNEPRVGWVWIPATDWAPAWVTWRSSDAYIGWAPCGPGLTVLAPSFFTFCDVHHFRDHFNRRDLIVNNTTIINRTKVIKNFQRETVNFDGRNRTIFANQGPGVDPIQRATGTKFTARPVREVIEQTRRPENIRRDEGQRPAEQPRHDIPAPTGRDQPRNYQQPNLNQHPETQAPQRPNLPAQRIPEQPKAQPVIPPTGREEPRVYRETPKPEVPTPSPKREIPVPNQRPVAPPERILPPTGRPDAPPAEHRDVTPPVHAPEVRPQAPSIAPHAPDGGHDGGHDGHNP
jgi:hypothetical protein